MFCDKEILSITFVWNFTPQKKNVWFNFEWLHTKNKTDKGFITRKVALLLFGLKYLTFSFNLIQIWKVVSNSFSRLKEINLDTLEEPWDGLIKALRLWSRVDQGLETP
jgi:hypothetical protein